MHPIPHLPLEVYLQNGAVHGQDFMVCGSVSLAQTVLLFISLDSDIYRFEQST